MEIFVIKNSSGKEPDLCVSTCWTQTNKKCISSNWKQPKKLFEFLSISIKIFEDINS